MFYMIKLVTKVNAVEKNEIRVSMIALTFSSQKNLTMISLIHKPITKIFLI